MKKRSLVRKNKNMRLVIVNGKFMSQRVTGVQRYAREMLCEIDKLLPENDDIKVILAVDPNAENIPNYQSIQVECIGKLHGNLWEQISLPLYVKKKKAICVSLCNMVPILSPDIAVIHDISFKVNPHFFSRKFSLWYRFVMTLTIKRMKKIITVSEFSKNEIIKYYHVDPSKVMVTYNGWQHFSNTPFDEDSLKKYRLEKGGYYFAMSSMAPNKNFGWIAEAAKRNPNAVFAVSGAVNSKVFGDNFDFEVPKNLKFLGYVSDEEAKTLMRDCKAFLFPTFYEGFGIPPLEAMSVGAKAVVSDASCMREIFEDSVYYVDPNNADVDFEQLLSEKVSDPQKILDKFSWQKSAEKFMEILE